MGKRAEVSQEEQTSIRLRLRVKCGACMFLNGQAAPAYKVPCSLAGKHKGSASCNEFAPNYTAIRDVAGEVQAITNLTKDMSDDVLHMAAYALVNARELHRTTVQTLGYALKVGQPVIVKLSAPLSDYLNCYFAAFVVGLTRDKKGLILYSSVNKASVHTILTLDPEIVMTVSEFAKRREKLIKAGRITAPAKALNSLLPEIKKQSIPNKPLNISRASKQLLRQNPNILEKRQTDRAYKVVDTKIGKKVSISD